MLDLDRLIAEDLGPRGDVTTRALFGAKARPVRARIFARERVVAAGLLEAAEVFGRFRVEASPRVLEGTWVPAGTTLLALDGTLSGVLGGERLALNLLGRLCGIATTTRRLQDRVARANPQCRVAATRKTTPGLRSIEKRAVALGGGDPHRYGLYDAVLIKDNHVDALGSVARAVRRARKAAGRAPIEVEVRSLSETEAAARARPDWILIDNAPVALAARMAKAARRIHPGVLVESSGGLQAANILRYARFSDRVSVGRLTHSAQSADVTLELRRSRSVKP